MSDIKKDLGGFRDAYESQSLTRADLDSDPIAQFDRWFEEASVANEAEANAMCLSTVSSKGQPAARTVLLKYFDDNGFVFYTNYGSRKAQEISENPQVVLLFRWVTLHRQVCITGQAEKISTKQSLQYFLTRPRGSQLGAWVSQQSKVISTRAVLEHALDDMKRKFANSDVPLPAFWGGYRVAHETIEFWQGRRNRLHDRFQYRRGPDGAWCIERLAP